MIFHTDFDTRTTKFICDECEKDISPQVFAELRRPWYRFWTKTIRPKWARPSLGSWKKQLIFHLGRWRIAVMFFKNDRYHDNTMYINGVNVKLR
jgi:hypothetical protein